MNQLDIKNMKVIKSTTFDLGLYSSVITASDDWIYTINGSELIIINRKTNDIHLKVDLKSVAYCCYLKEYLLFIGSY